MPWNLAFADPPALLDRCQTGLLRLVRDQPGYASKAALPDLDWTDPTAGALGLPGPAPGTPTGALVEIIALPDAPDHRAHPDAIAGYWPLGRGERLLGFTDCPPDQRTTTVDHAHGHRLGIHLDNFDRQPIGRRELSRRRLALNLGPGPRYLVLALATIQDIAGQAADFPRYPHTDDVHRYLGEGRTLPCLRLRLEPGEGYIAPTELIPHDGSTHGFDQPSRIAFWLGHWPGPRS